MFEGEKTYIFWIGLIMLGLASVGLFQILWMMSLFIYPSQMARMLEQAVPVLFGGVVFILIGLYMMKSGVKKKDE